MVFLYRTFDEAIHYCVLVARLPTVDLVPTSPFLSSHHAVSRAIRRPSFRTLTDAGIGAT